MELKDVYIVKTNNLSKSYNKKTVINSCNMSVKKWKDILFGWTKWCGKDNTI